MSTTTWPGPADGAGTSSNTSDSGGPKALQSTARMAADLRGPRLGKDEAVPPTRVEVVEVSPRDGLQAEDVVLPVEARVALIERALAAGVRRIEVCSFVNPARVPQMAGAEEVLAALPARDDVTYIGLVLNRRGFERAAATGMREINVVAVATDTFGQRNQGATSDESVAI